VTEFDPDAEAAALAAGLHEAGTPERAEGEKRYLKSDLEFLGVTVPTVRRAATGLRRRWPELSHDDLVDLVRRLWEPGVFELRLAGIELLRAYSALLSPADLELVLRTPEAGAVLDRWARDSDFWVRRSALLALLPGIRSGDGDLARLDRYAEAMLAEQEFFVRKAIGWVLRELVRTDPAFVTRWVGARTDRISGVSLREAVRHLPQADRERLLDAYRRRAVAE
jgi:3-methyladenine DNA glycosylase AlkD